MENLIICFGIISCLWIGVFGKESVTVGDDVFVKPTPNPLIDPNDNVEVTLTCTGSRSDLSYYIKNSVVWNFTADGKPTKAVTQSFYRATDSQFADNHFDSGHMSIKYGINEATQGYDFALTISGVTHADNGIYRCSLIESGNVTDSKEMRLTVLHPVDRVTIEILNANNETIADKHTPNIEGQAPVELTPGNYYVRCTATGSNPAPKMSLFYNEQHPSVNVKNALDTSANRVKNTGTFTKMITVNAHTVPQELMCQANIPGNHYVEKQAGLTMMVQVDKPDMKCGNFSSMLGARYAKVKCNISADGKSNQGLLCEKVSWMIGDEKQVISYDQRWKDPSQKFDIVESRCLAGPDGLQVGLMVYKVKSSHFVETYYLVYGTGDKSHRLPLQLNEIPTAGVAGVEASVSLLMAVVMAAVVKHLAL